jgi:hypothetical protein
MVFQEDNVIFISTVRFSNSVYNDTDQKIKQIWLSPVREGYLRAQRIRIDLCGARIKGVEFGALQESENKNNNAVHSSMLQMHRSIVFFS